MFRTDAAWPSFVQCRQNVERQIRQRTWGRVSHLRVELDGDRLTVRGCTPSYYVKQLAIQAALDAVGSEEGLQLDVDIEVASNPMPAHEGRDVEVGRF